MCYHDDRPPAFALRQYLAALLLFALWFVIPWLVGLWLMLSCMGCVRVTAETPTAKASYTAFARKADVRGFMFTENGVEFERASGDVSEAVTSAAQALRAVAKAAR